MDAAELGDLEAIRQLKYRYLRLLDQNRIEEMVDLFTEDATAAYSDGKWTLNGRAEILAFLGRRRRVSLHTAHHPEISLAGPDTALGTWALEDLQYYDDGTMLHGAAYYHDVYVRVDGRWRIKSTGYERSFEYRGQFPGTVVPGPASAAAGSPVPGDASASPPSLEKRIARIEAEKEIVRTLYQYAHTLDYGPEAEFLDCFVEDGSWERTRARQEGEPVRFEGREGLLRFFRDPSRGRAPAVYFKHLVAEPRITFEDDEADVTSYFVRLQEHPEGPYLYAFGRYRDRLRRDPDGRWRFVRRLAETESTQPHPR